MVMPYIFRTHPICNGHSHIRESGEPDVMADLIKKAINGGADVLLPMPNTTAGLRTCAQVLSYIDVACSLVPKNRVMSFIPTIMITEDTTDEELEKCAKAGIKDGKAFPLERTTKSENGVRDYSILLPRIKTCGRLGIKVHLHPEHPLMVISNRDAEYVFLSIADMFLRETNAIIIWEHGTDSRCIPAWKEMAQTGRFYVTLTAHHLAWNEDQAFGDVRRICKPPMRQEIDRIALIHLVEQNFSWVVVGPDDAPHDKNKKHVHVGKCACGQYTAPFLLQLYAHALDDMISSETGREIFINFTSRNPRKLHGLPGPAATCQLIRQEFLIPNFYNIGSWTVEPPGAGEKLLWQLAA